MSGPTLAEIIDLLYPVGRIWISEDSTSPATVLGRGTWAAYASGRVLVGRDSGDTDFDTAGETGGAKTVTLTEAQMPVHTHVQNSHNHTQDAHTHVQNAHAHVQNQASLATGGLNGSTPDTSTSTSVASGYSTANATAVNQNATATNQAATAVNQNAGSGGAHANVQPYIVVYMWKRTA
jgi:microcystin-dependent protein